MGIAFILFDVATSIFVVNRVFFLIGFVFKVVPVCSYQRYTGSYLHGIKCIQLPEIKILMYIYIYIPIYAFVPQVCYIFMLKLQVLIN